MASIKQAFDLSGKTALITGDSRGIGLQIAEALGEQGAYIEFGKRMRPAARRSWASIHRFRTERINSTRID